MGDGSGGAAAVAGWARTGCDSLRAMRGRTLLLLLGGLLVAVLGATTAAMPAPARAQAVPGAIALERGMTAVTYTGPTATVEQAFGRVLPAIESVWGREAGFERWLVWSHALSRAQQSLRWLRRGERYWIRSVIPVAWSYPGLGGTPALQFTEVTEAAGVTYVQHGLSEPGSCLLEGGAFGVRVACTPERVSGGAAVADANGDGWPDLYVTRLDTSDILFINQGDGTFVDGSEAAGLTSLTMHTNGAWWGDIDNDGDADLFVTTIAEAAFLLLINDGQGRFTEEAVTLGAAVADESPRSGMSVTMGDFDRDGWLDVHTAEWRLAPSVDDPSVTHGRLLRNRGAEAPGFFEDVTEAAGLDMADLPSLTHSPRNGIFSFGTAFADLDGDGWQDLAVSADFGRSRLFWNNGDGTFTDGTVAAGLGSDENGMGFTLGDVDGDGDLDWFVTAIHTVACLDSGCRWDPSGNRLYLNDGNRVFSDVTDEQGVREGYWGWGAVFLDADNDADLDLTMTNGMLLTVAELPFQDDPMRFWENVRNGPMQERSAAVGLTATSEGKGLLTFDYDLDGDLDIFVVDNGLGPVLYRNDSGNTRPWLRVEVEGTASNRDGVGARVLVTAFEGGPVQLREVGVGSHFLGQSELTAHFGLGAVTGPVHEVTVQWPLSGATTVLHAVPRDATIRVQEGQEGFVVVRPGAE